MPFDLHRAGSVALLALTLGLPGCERLAEVRPEVASKTRSSVEERADAGLLQVLHAGHGLARSVAALIGVAIEVLPWTLVLFAVALGLHPLLRRRRPRLAA